MNGLLILSLVFGYLLGSIPFTQLIAKAVKNIDLREVGSKNVGARNTTKNVGLGWGILAGLLDTFKSYFAIYLSTRLGADESIAIWAGLLAIVGHNWPIWLKFQGGKGLGTMMGVAIWLAPLEATIAIGIALIILKLTKNIFLTSMVGFATIIGLVYLWQDPLLTIPYILIGFFIISAASLRQAIEIIKSPGGLTEYFDNPNKVYENDNPQSD